MLKELKKLRPVPISRNLRKAHPLIQDLREYYKTANTDDKYANRYFTGYNKIQIKVTRNLLHRALIIADSLVKELERLGYLDSNHPGYITIEGEKISYVIEEPTKRSKTKYPPGHYLEYEYLATGKLKLRIESYPARTWSESHSRRIEDCLPALIQEAEDRVHARIQEKLEGQRKAEEEQKEKERIETLYFQALAEYENEERKADKLLSNAKKWQQSLLIRDYIDAKIKYHSNDGYKQLDEDVIKWVKWAKAQADRLDPLQDSPPSILDNRRPRLSDFS